MFIWGDEVQLSGRWNLFEFIDFYLAVNNCENSWWLHIVIMHNLWLQIISNYLKVGSTRNFPQIFFYPNKIFFFPVFFAWFKSLSLWLFSPKKKLPYFLFALSLKSSSAHKIYFFFAYSSNIKIMIVD